MFLSRFYRPFYHLLSLSFRVIVSCSYRFNRFVSLFIVPIYRLPMLSSPGLSGRFYRLVSVVIVIVRYYLGVSNKGYINYQLSNSNVINHRYQFDGFPTTTPCYGVYFF